MTLTTADGPAFIALMKHYVLDYTNRNDQSQTPAIMEPDYVLRMGEHIIMRRAPATRSACSVMSSPSIPNICRRWPTARWKRWWMACCAPASISA